MAKTLDLQQNINEALGYHKNGLFELAITKYEEILPLIPSGALASTLHSNVGAIYMNNLGKYITWCASILYVCHYNL